MSQNGASTAVQTEEYEDFVPSSELVPHKDADTLCVYVPGTPLFYFYPRLVIRHTDEHCNPVGFSKEQMTVQLARKVILKISGQRRVGQKKYQRFQMEFPDEVINDATTGAASDFFAKLKTPNKVINMTLVALLILGIGGYVINAMKSSKKAKK